MKTKFSLLILCTSMLFTINTTSCNQLDNGIPYIKGEYVGTYCDGVVIKIIDKNGIGKTWNGQDGTSYTNSVVASVDSIYIKSIEHPEIYFKTGTIFYFKYKTGGYPRLQYNLCEPAPFITITYLSITSPEHN